MTKVKTPLLSFDARRKLGDDIVFARRRQVNIVETRPKPYNVRSLAQLSWRHMFQKVVALWHALSDAEKEAWESLGRRRHMTGYAWFMSQALRPNPGIYLPLQGGIMQGDIDMAGFKIEDLPDPLAAQEPATKAYVDALTKIVWKDASEEALADLNRIAPLAWTDLDLTAYTSPTAKIAILLLYTVVAVYANGNVNLGVRKNGTTPNYYPILFIDENCLNTGFYARTLVLCGMDTGQVIEYRIAIPGAATVHSYIEVLGYVE